VASLVVIEKHTFCYEFYCKRRPDRVTLLKYK
jgi:hypothetical protein